MWLMFLAAMPPGFVDLKTIPGLGFDLRYGTADNFTGKPLPGYEKPGAWLLDAPAKALARVQKKEKLCVYDAYRPVRATQAMVTWANTTGNAHLLKGYIAPKSFHNHGIAVDITICGLDMGTPWDTLTTASHTQNATGEALKNRLRLKAAMEAEGFKAYYREWWHFSYPVQGSKPYDVAYE